MSEDRSVATDALKTIGNLIDETAGRDAVHFAVEPVVAAVSLAAGERIGLQGDGKATSNRGVEILGIVDPFLTEIVKPGQRFWMIVLPRTITSLRHVWVHPSFPDKTVPAHKSASQAWIDSFAAEHDLRAPYLLEAAQDYLDNGEYFYHPEDPGRFEGEHVPDEFWPHYEAVTGKFADPNKRGDFFSCRC